MPPNKREILKYKLFNDPKRRVYARGQVHVCEGQDHVAHTCAGGIEMNEVFLTRGLGRNMSANDVDYFFDEKNCALNCSLFHTKHGHTRAYREHVRERHNALYGKTEMALYLQRAPLKNRIQG